jgi:hypothetical protein
MTAGTKVTFSTSELFPNYTQTTLAVNSGAGNANVQKQGGPGCKLNQALYPECLIARLPDCSRRNMQKLGKIYPKDHRIKYTKWP